MNNIVNNQSIRNSAKILLLVSWLSVIFFFSSQPNLSAIFAHSFEIIIRKLAHFFEYAFLFFLFYKVVSLKSDLSFSGAMWLSFVLTVVYATTDEVHQFFVENRTASPLDIFIDTFGALISTWLMILEHDHQVKNPGKKHLLKI